MIKFIRDIKVRNIGRFCDIMFDVVRFDLFIFFWYCGSVSGVVGLCYIFGVVFELCWLVVVDFGIVVLFVVGFLGVIWGGEFVVKLIFVYNVG